MSRFEWFKNIFYSLVHLQMWFCFWLDNIKNSISGQFSISVAVETCQGNTRICSKQTIKAQICMRIHTFSSMPVILALIIEKMGRYIENTRWVSFDIKFTRQGFKNACWHRKACRAIQHVFSKQNLVHLISKDASLIFYLSVYQLIHFSN